MALDRVRELVLELVKRDGTDLKTVSLAIPRNHAYLHQFITQNKPRALSEEVREALGRKFGVDPDDFRAAPRPKGEHTLISKFRTLSKNDQRVMLRVADGLAGSKGVTGGHD